MSTGDLNVLRAQSFFAQCPEAVGVITDEGVLVASNVRFERTVGPASKLEGRNFLVNVVSAEDHARFKIAMQRARAACSGPSVDAPDGCASDLVEWASTPTMRSCATMALGNEGDFPVWRKMDWTLSVFDDTRLILTGRLSSMGPAAPGVEVSAEMGGEEPYFEPPAERELLDFLNKAPIAMHWLSGTGHVLWANETELNVLGYTAEEYIGQPIMNFCPDESELVLEIFKSLGSGNAIKDVPVRFRTKDGRVKHLLIDSNVNWNADGSFRHTRCFIRDDTLRKVREERLRVTREKEEELSNAKDVFFRKVFHDIRTPTHEIAGKIRELQTWVAALPEGDQEGTVKTKSLVLDWQKLLSLVEDAADATLYHMGKVPLLNNTQPFSVKRALQMVCGDMLAEGRVALGVSCTVALGIGHSNEIPWSAASSQGLEWSQLSDVDTIVSDRSRVLRVLRFLLQAALERATIGNGSVKMSATYWPRKEAHGIPKMAFSVSDTGRHLDLAWVNGCFQSYFRTEGEGDEGRTDLSLSGSGQDGLELGLYVSYHVVQALGGTLECTPHTLDTGTTFTFDLPAQSLEKGDGQSSPSAPFEDSDVYSDVQDDGPGSWTDVGNSKVADQHGLIGADAQSSNDSFSSPPVGIEAELKRRPHVLIADPHFVSQHVASKLLRSLNCTVEVAGNGLQATKILQSNPECFDAVLMHLNLPVIDGIECAKLIRQDDRLNNMPLIALLDDEEMLREDLAELGFQGLLKKPIQRSLLDKELLSAVQAGSVQRCNFNFGALDMQAPYRAASASEPRLPPQTPTNSSAPAGLKCLIVEDNRVCMCVARKMMQKLGFHVECADNGLSGFQMLKEDSTRADLVLMDLRMPVMDGLQATRKIRQELGLKSLAIIALTAEIVDDSWAADFNSVVNKPFCVARIRLELDRILPEWQGERDT